MDTITTLTSFDQGAMCEGLTTLQVAAGFVTWMNIMKVFAVLLGGVCAVFLFGRTIMRIAAVFSMLPVAFHEFLGYAASIAMIGGAALADGYLRTWLLVLGCLAFAGMIAISGKLRNAKPNPAGYSMMVAVLWASAALGYHNDIVAFGSVMALMAALGFSVAITPLCYSIGFESESAVTRASAAALVLSLLAILAHSEALRPAVEGSRMEIFMPGIVWMGSIVLGLGALIKSSRWSGGEAGYGLRQMPAISCIMLLMFGGAISGIEVMRNAGVAFLALYLLEKPFEIPHRSLTAYAATGLVTAVIVGFGINWLQGNPAAIETFMNGFLSK